MVRAGGSAEVEGCWPCRVCKTPVEITSAGLEAWQGFNKYLRSKREAPIDSSQVAVCARCRETLQRQSAINARRVSDKLRWCVRVLRDGGTPEDEREAIKYLDKHDNERCSDDKDKSATVAYWTEKRRASKGSGGKADW